ncbi:DUF2202 domain-containing protein [Polaribacter aquimarinus]|uniref:DUF2202 domain-containing protein n=1 Tax=Polaribacter aquimarinus TaxID=2100726 RepID=A0A2U2JB99_9FLAO|nr:DUF2202 domain-containing protein [Polaribacter aquimarinus]PWG05619.1 hypothetical protein DIS07_04015 [Polaribacter aquimarinus]
MKAKNKIQYLFTFILLILIANACSKDIEDEFIVDVTEENVTIIQEDSEALLFMLEEEKLARDTYKYLHEKWNLNQFANIKNSEQSHMNAIENLLKQYKLSYTILPEGVFNNPELQTLYDTFKIDGTKSVIEALKIGATIEDLDIKDLETYVSLTKNNTLIKVYQNLICGSRNHLRSFIKSLEKKGGTYTPKFITQDAYNNILNSSQEKCN